ncbi:MAG: hypothetical protein QM604_00550 [Microbacterium sp.]
MTVHLSETVAATPASDALVVIIGVMALVSLIGVAGALFSLGRSPYRKDR